MRIISWNVNGLRACVKKGFHEFLESSRADVLCLQEVRALPEQLDERTLNPHGWYTQKGKGMPVLRFILAKSQLALYLPSRKKNSMWKDDSLSPNSVDYRSHRFTFRKAPEEIVTTVEWRINWRFTRASRKNSIDCEHRVLHLC